MLRQRISPPCVWSWIGPLGGTGVEWSGGATGLDQGLPLLLQPHCSIKPVGHSGRIGIHIQVRAARQHDRRKRYPIRGSQAGIIFNLVLPANRPLKGQPGIQIELQIRRRGGQRRGHYAEHGANPIGSAIKSRAIESWSRNIPLRFSLPQAAATRQTGKSELNAPFSISAFPSAHYPLLSTWIERFLEGLSWRK
jgi:hypothetical protein